jgi:hypothetical protein
MYIFFSKYFLLMNTILNEENIDFEEKISLDELYEEKQNSSLFELETFKKILTKIQKKIKTVARMKQNNTFCFYVVPEFIFGCPKYNIQECISYILEKLVDNGFHIKYTHPNLLFISWKHYIPNYKRQEIKQKTGLIVDGFGNIIESKKSTNNQLLVSNKEKVTKKQNDYKSIDSHKPTSIYDNAIINLNP